MAAQLKLTPALLLLCQGRRAAGFSYREIAAWLEATHGVSVSHMQISRALADAASRAVEAPKGEPAPQESKSKRRENKADDPESGTDAADIRLLDEAIEDLQADIEKARLQGATQALATLQRLLFDAVERRRKLRPPAPPTEVDAETMAAGAKAAEKLRRLIADARKGAAA